MSLRLLALGVLCTVLFAGCSTKKMETDPAAPVEDLARWHRFAADPVNTEFASGAQEAFMLKLIFLEPAAGAEELPGLRKRGSKKIDIIPMVPSDDRVVEEYMRAGMLKVTMSPNVTTLAGQEATIEMQKKVMNEDMTEAVFTWVRKTDFETSLTEDGTPVVSTIRFTNQINQQTTEQELAVNLGPGIYRLSQPIEIVDPDGQTIQQYLFFRVEAVDH